MGDFNVNLLSIENISETLDFQDALSSHFFVPFIYQRTRIASVDNKFLNSFEFKLFNLILKVLDHLLQFNELFEYNYRSQITNFNNDEFKSDLTGITWDYIFLKVTCQLTYLLIRFIIALALHLMKILQSTNSVKKISLKVKPWITKHKIHLTSLMNEFSNNIAIKILPRL